MNIYCTIRHAVIMCGVFLFVSCGDSKEKSSGSTEHKFPDVEIYDVKLKQIDIDYQKVYFSTPLINIYTTIDDPYQECPKGIVMYRYYNDEKTEYAFVKADYAIYYEKNGIWTLKDNVVMYSLEGDTLYTDLINIDESQDRIWSDKLVRGHRKEEVIIGLGVESNIAFTKYTIYQPTGHILVDN